MGCMLWHGTGRVSGLAALDHICEDCCAMFGACVTKLSPLRAVLSGDGLRVLLAQRWRQKVQQHFPQLQVRSLDKEKIDAQHESGIHIPPFPDAISTLKSLYEVSPLEIGSTETVISYLIARAIGITFFGADPLSAFVEGKWVVGSTLRRKRVRWEPDNPAWGYKGKGGWFWGWSMG